VWVSKMSLDVNIFRQFVRKVIPDLTDDEVLYAYIQARRKYYPELNSHDPVIDRTLIRDNDFEAMVHKMHRLRAISNTARDRKTGKIIPEYALTIYIDINPKSIDKGFTSFVSEFMNKQYAYRLDRGDKLVYKNPDIMLMANIHKSYSRKPYMIIDVDDKEITPDVIDCIEGGIVWVSETQGGHHIIIKNDNNDATNSFIEIRKRWSSLIRDKTIEFKRNCTTPVPGSFQNSFLVKEWDEI